MAILLDNLDIKSASEDIKIPIKKYTLAMWYKMSDTLAGNADIFRFEPSANAGQERLMIKVRNTNPNDFIIRGFGGTWYSDLPIELGNWSYLSCIANGDWLWVYHNNILVYEKSWDKSSHVETNFALNLNADRTMVNDISYCNVRVYDLDIPQDYLWKIRNKIGARNSIAYFPFINSMEDYGLGTHSMALDSVGSPSELSYLIDKDNREWIK